MTEYDDADRRVDPSAPQWPPRLAPRGDWASLDDLGLQSPPPAGAPAGSTPNGAPGAGAQAAPGPMPAIPGPLQVPRPPTPQPAPAPQAPVAPPAPAAPPPSSPFGSQLNAWGSAAQQTEATVSRPPVATTPDDILSAVAPNGGGPAAPAPAPDEWATAATEVRGPAPGGPAAPDPWNGGGAAAVDVGAATADPWGGQPPGNGFGPTASDADPAPRWVSRAGQAPDEWAPAPGSGPAADPWATQATQVGPAGAGAGAAAAGAAGGFALHAGATEPTSPFAPQAGSPEPARGLGADADGATAAYPASPLAPATDAPGPVPLGAPAGPGTEAFPASPFAPRPGEAAGGRAPEGATLAAGAFAPAPGAPGADPWAARAPAPGTPAPQGDAPRPGQAPPPGAAGSPWAAQMPEPGAADGPWAGQGQRPGAPGAPAAWPDQAARLDGPDQRPAPPAPEPAMAYGTPAPADAYAPRRPVAPNGAGQGYPPDPYSGPGGYGMGRSPAPGYPSGGYPPPPGYGNGGPGGAHAAHAAGAGASAQKFRPGAGLVVGILGLVALVLSFTALPWATGGGEEASFQDIRDAVTSDVYLAPASPEVVGAAPGESAAAAQQDPMAPTTTLPTFNTVSPTLPDGSPMIPSTGADPSLGTTSPTTPALESDGVGSSEFKRDYIDAFASYGWIVVIVWAALAMAFAALFVPAGYGGRIATGFLVLGVIGALINLADRRGSVGPRLCGALATLAVGAAFGVGVSILFDGDFAPSIGYGVWVGAAGLGLVLVACLMGTRRAPVTA